MDDRKRIELYELMLKLAEGTISHQEMRLLDAELLNDPEVVRMYNQFMVSYVWMVKKKQISASTKNALDSITQLELWKELAEHEKTAPSVNVEEEAKTPAVIQKVERQKNSYKLSKFNIVSLFMSAAAILLLVLFVKYVPTRDYSTQAATLMDQVDAKWGNAGSDPAPGDRLWTNEAPLELVRGIVKIQYDNGVKVLVEGPAVFMIERTGLYLEYGRLYSIVSQEGMGFTVQTPTSQFVDMGTEFGVQAEIDGSSELHVTKGKVRLFAASGGRSRVSQLIHESNAVRYDSVNMRINEVSIKKTVFVREISSETSLVWRGQKKLNLADIVGGGDGFDTGQIDKGIKHSGELAVLSRISYQEFSSDQCIPVPSSPFVEGVFLPSGPTPISLTGELSYDFGPNGKRLYLGVLNGAWHKNQEGTVPKHSLRLGGITYGPPKNNPAIYMHANQGITFDLEAIRNHTQMMPRVFSAVCGISESYQDYLEGLKNSINFRGIPKASFFVLVDGEVVFEKKDTRYTDLPGEITVALEPESRFLTLVTTQGSDGSNGGDWTLFGEPVLLMESP